MAAADEAAVLTGIVAGKAAVVRARLAVVQVELDAEHGLRPPDRELEVRAEASPGVPFMIAGARVVAVVEVTAHRGDLIEGSADRHLRRRNRLLRQDDRSRRCESDEGEDGRHDGESLHHRILPS